MGVSTASLAKSTTTRSRRDARAARVFREHRRAVGDELTGFVRRARVPRLRTMRRFAEEEIVIPDGPFQGRRFRCDRQPYTGLWLDAVDSGEWSRIVSTGPTQSGKTLCCFIIPLLYHLFEIGETVICGLPDLGMASEKWLIDIEPAIARSKYRDLLPKRGKGSRGGSTLESVTFGSGVVLKFMTGGGGDKVRAHFTSRVVVITETDGMDVSGAASREADKITQIENRTVAYDDRRRVYMECTVSVEEGRTWREYERGTKSRLVLPCPHCGVYVSPEREHLVGWQDTDTAEAARDVGTFACPECGKPWTFDQRASANRGGRVLHRGQEISDSGAVTGAAPRTDTLGFRWSAVHNLFWKAGTVAAREWIASKAEDEDNAEKEMCQFVWAVPHESPFEDLAPLSRDAVVRRVHKTPKGFVPPTIVRGDAVVPTAQLTLGVDLGAHLGHWVLLATGDDKDRTPHVCDYGCFDIRSRELTVQRATLQALRAFQDVVLSGWSTEGGVRVPDQVWIDSGWFEQTDTVYAFTREAGLRFRPTKGYGASQERDRNYRVPKSTGATIKDIGESYHLSYIKAGRINLVEMNADYWKSRVHTALGMAADALGAMTLYQGMPNEHRSFAHHLTAEKQVQTFVLGKGMQTTWEKVRRNNHWLDALYAAMAAAEFCARKRREAAEKSAAQAKETTAAGLRTPDGRAYLVTQR